MLKVKNNLDFFKQRVSDRTHIDIIFNWPSLSDNIEKKNIDKNDKKILKKIFYSHDQIKKNKLLSAIYIGNSGHAQDLENNLNYLLNLKLKINFILDIFLALSSQVLILALICNLFHGRVLMII